MAEDRTTTLISVELDMGAIEQKLATATAAVNRLKDRQKELTVEQKKLAKQYADGEITLEAFNKEMQRNTKEFAANAGEIDANNRVVKSSTALIQAETIGRLENNASLDEQRQALNTLQKAYAQLSGEQKEMADAEGGLRDQINALSDSVKEQETAIGDSRRNVGNYEGAILSAADKAHLLADSFKATAAGSTALGKGIDSVDKTMKVMTKNPLMGIVVALAPILSKIISLVTQNKSVMEALHKVMKPLGDALGWIADLVGNVLVAALDALASAWRTVSGFFGSIISWFTGSTEVENEAAIAAEEYAKQVENLTAQLNKEQKALSQLQKDNKYHLDLLKARGATERELFLQRAKDLQEELELQKQIYSDAEAAFQAYQSQLKAANGLTKEGRLSMTEEEHKKWEEMKTAREDAYNSMVEMDRAYNVMAVQFATDEANERERLQKESAERRKKRLEEQQKEEQAVQAEINLIRRREQSDLENRVEDLKNAAEQELSIKGLTEQQKLAIQAYYNAEEARLRAEASAAEVQAEVDRLAAKQAAREQFGIEPGKTEEEAELERARIAHEQGLLEDEEYERAKTLILEKYLDQRQRSEQEELNRAKDALAERNEAMMQSFGQLSGALRSVSDLLGEYAEQNEDVAKAQKAMALGSILIDQAMSIASGAQAIAAAMAGAAEAAAATGPAAPFTLVAYQAQMVGQVLALIASVASTITQAKQVFASAGNFAEGGVVGGSSYTGDKLIAHVNSGEGIYNGRQANSLLQEIANNPLRGGTEMMTEALTEALTHMPAPVMDYTEFKSFEQDVSNIKEIARV